MIHSRFNRTPAAAFTLTELLIVLVVLSVLTVVAAPSLYSRASGSRLTATGDLILNKLSEAQQQAVASNSEVEVRFLERPGSRGLDDVRRLRAFQLLTLGTSEDAGAEAAFLPATPMIPFGEGIVMSSNPKMSSLIEAGFKNDAGSSEDRERYLAVRFLPDGSTNLASGSPWFLTLVSTESEGSEGLPANFYTLQIDPVTGRIRSFRP